MRAPDNEWEDRKQWDLPLAETGLHWDRASASSPQWHCYREKKNLGFSTTAFNDLDAMHLYNAFYQWHVQSISKRLPIDKRQYLQAFCISYTRYQCLLFTFIITEEQSQCSLYQEYKPVLTSQPSNIPQKNLTFHYNTVSQSYIY